MPSTSNRPGFHSIRVQRAHRKNAVEQIMLNTKIKVLDDDRRQTRRQMTHDMHLVNQTIDCIQASSGISPEGVRPPDAAPSHHVTVGSRPSSAADQYSITTSGRRVIKPRGHSAPPRRHPPGYKAPTHNRPHTSQAYQNPPVILESDDDGDYSDADDDAPDRPPKPLINNFAARDMFLVSQERQKQQAAEKQSDYISTAALGVSRILAPGGAAGAGASPSGAPPATLTAGSRLPRTGFNTRPLSGRNKGDDEVEETVEVVPQKRHLGNPRTAEIVKAVNRERALAQKARKMQMKPLTPAVATTHVAPISFASSQRYKQVMDLKLFLQKKQMKMLDQKLEEFKNKYPIKIYRSEAMKPPNHISI